MKSIIVVKVSMPSAEQGADKGVGAAGPLVAKAVNEDGSQSWDIPLTEKFLKRQGTQATRFYFAYQRDDGSLKLDNFASWREW